MDGALNAVLAGPAHHLPRSFAVFDAPQADFAQDGHSRGREFFEIVFDHSVFKHGRAGQDLYSARTKRMKTSLCADRHRLEADNVFGSPRRVHLTR